MNFSSSCETPNDNSVNSMDRSDEVWVVRPDVATCSNRHFSTSYAVPRPTVSTVSTNDDDDYENEELVVILAVISSLFGAIIVVLLFGVYFLYNQLHSKNFNKLLANARSDNTIDNASGAM